MYTVTLHFSTLSGHIDVTQKLTHVVKYSYCTSANALVRKLASLQISLLTVLPTNI